MSLSGLPAAFRRAAIRSTARTALAATTARPAAVSAGYSFIGIPPARNRFAHSTPEARRAQVRTRQKKGRRGFPRRPIVLAPRGNELDQNIRGMFSETRRPEM